MGDIFETQDWLRIKLRYTAEISASIKSAVIKYKKPEGTPGSFVGTHVPAEKYFYYDLIKGSPLGISAETIKRWTFWIGATANDDRYAPGEIATVLVKEEGTS